MSSNTCNRRSVGVVVLGAAAAAVIGAGSAHADSDLQISIDGYDLFPTAGNLATATTDPGSIEFASSFGNPAFFDTAAAFGNGVHASATSDSDVTDIEPAAAVPAAATTGPFEELFGDGGINTWTPSADALLLADDPSLAATLSTSVESFHAAGFSDDALSNLAFELDSTGFGGVEPSDIGLPENFPDAGYPQDLLATLAVGTDYALYASGLSSLGTDATYLVQIPADIAIFLAEWPLIFAVL